MMTLFFDRFKNPKPKIQNPRAALEGKQNPKKTHIVTIAHSVSNRRKNENPVQHVTKTTPNAIVKKFIITEKTVHNHAVIFSKARNENTKMKIQKNTSKLTIPTTKNPKPSDKSITCIYRLGYSFHVEIDCAC